MNIIYETTKERGPTILMPSSMVDSLNPSAATLAFALAGNTLPLDRRGAGAIGAAIPGNGAVHPALAGQPPA
jgi:hypothetical protein